MKTNENFTSVKSTQILKPVLWFFLICCGLLIVACQQEANVSKDTKINGVYNLVSVDGNTLPAKINHDGVNLEVRSGSFTINADGTCGTKTTFVPPNGSETIREVSASFNKSGSKLTMNWKGAGTTTGTIEGNTFTMNNEGMIFIYKK